MTFSDKIKILLVNSGQHCENVRLLLRNFVDWHLERHTEDKDLISQYFDQASFESELNELPGKYVYPDGALLLACYENSPAGCVALRKMDSSSCEMKRMFVYEQYHGLGIGRRLSTEIVNEAKKLGYSKMKLDTSFRQIEAINLYQSLGFKKCKPYYDLPIHLKNWLVFMEFSL